MNNIQKRIHELWEQNCTAGDIAKDLNMTRNAVMGQLYRMRMAGVKMRGKVATKSNPVPKAVGKKKMIRRLPAPIKPTLEEITIQYDPKPTGKPVPLMQLKLASCRYVVSGATAKDFLFCNEPQQPSSSYCVDHHRICYVPKSSIRELRAKKDASTA